MRVSGGSGREIKLLHALVVDPISSVIEIKLNLIVLCFLKVENCQKYKEEFYKRAISFLDISFCYDCIVS